MREARVACAAALVVALAVGCGHGSSAPSAVSPSEALSVRLETAHFRLLGDRVGDDVLRAVADRLEADLPRVQADLGVASVRTMTVKVWQDQAAWAAEVQRFFGRGIDTMGYVTGPDEVRVLAGSPVVRNAAHEMAHCVSLYVNPTFGNNPRWLWESVALFENRELVDPRSLGYMVAGRPPTLQQLDADVTVSRQVYDVGFLIGEFVTARAGQTGLVALVRSSGDTAAVLGLSTPEFEAAWYAFVRERYLQ